MIKSSAKLASMSQMLSTSLDFFPSVFFMQQKVTSFFSQQNLPLSFSNPQLLSYILFKRVLPMTFTFCYIVLKSRVSAWLLESRKPGRKSLCFPFPFPSYTLPFIRKSHIPLTWKLLRDMGINPANNQNLKHVSMCWYVITLQCMIIMRKSGNKQKQIFNLRSLFWLT